MSKTNTALGLVRRPAAVSYARPATIVASGSLERLAVTMLHEGRELRVPAVVAVAPAPALSWGDRVLVAGEDLDVCYVIGVIESSAREARVATRSGASAVSIDRDGDERIEVRDREARLLFAYDPDIGRGTLSMPEGDLSLEAPRGSIELVSAGPIRCKSEASVSISAGSSSLELGRSAAKISSHELELRSRRADILFGEATYRGERFSAAVEQAKVVTRKLETVAGWVFARARSVFRKVDDVDQLEAGRTRTLVQGSHTVRAACAAIEAERDVKIDGSSIHLG
jgi:hypothetical protein